MNGAHSVLYHPNISMSLALWPKMECSWHLEAPSCPPSPRRPPSWLPVAQRDFSWIYSSVASPGMCFFASGLFSASCSLCGAIDLYSHCCRVYHYVTISQFILVLFCFVLFCFVLFLAMPTAFGSSQARDGTLATASTQATAETTPAP